MGQACFTDVGMIQDNFILPVLPVRGLPISQDMLDRMKLVGNRTIPMMLPSRKKKLVNFMFKIIIGYTNLGTRQLQSRLGSRVCLFITSNANVAGYPLKKNVFIGTVLKDTLSYHHPNQEIFQLHVL